ncbi:BTB/POZ domain-containing protein 9-like [Contarinia nasturtii]|uniref:BTB/POZ domain-containing protein 9-like n=1 Tax=Contarinia nasturtii TaxID=265458 RepID=UPI0012D3879D|nr:BTB/POZ domain-containing protein 9-like [Contarinia nasturtii]
MANEIMSQYGEIDETHEILQRYTRLYMNDKHSDVIIVVDDNKIPAHKLILSASSSYFHALFSNGLVETSKNEIKLQVPLDAFKTILKYIYTGRISFVNLNVGQITDLFDLANMYQFDSLKGAISKYLNHTISIENCHSILHFSNLYSLESLRNDCLNFIDNNAIDFLNQETLKEIPQDMLCDLLKRDTFYVPEIDIFNAMKIWHEANPNADIKVILSEIRWSFISMNEMIKIVVPSKILDLTQMWALFEKYHDSSTPARCAPTSSISSLREVNIATAEHGAKRISGERWNGLFEQNVAHHSINYPGNGITIQLGKISLINHIKFSLYSENNFSYRVYTSIDGTKFDSLVDYSTYSCRSWQFLYFPTRYVQYIRLIGMRSTDDYFYVNEFEAMQKEKVPEIVDGLVKPAINVATTERGAVVLEGGGANKMLNSNLDEFTCHDINNGSIIVQLGQPYHIGSFRLLLGNKLSSSSGNSFYIETSLDKSTWEMAVDKRNESLASSWHQFEFAARPVIFIKITGTQGTLNIFSCTQFECPSSVQK